MKCLSIIAFFLITSSSIAQSNFDKSRITKATNNIVTKIVKVNELMGSAVYYEGIRPKQYDNFIQLKETANQSELIELTNHPNGVVRCYSFWALSYDNSIDLYPLILSHIGDDESVNTQFGCIGGSEKVGDFFINVATPQYVDLDSKKLQPRELANLDSILIFMPNNLTAKSAAILRTKPSENLYHKIRELVVKNHDQSALVSLAKYQKQQDIDLILKNREKSEFVNDGYFFTYQAISLFPQPEFLPLLENNLMKTLEDTHYSTEWRELYKAIASFKNQKAIELLKVPLTQVKHEDIKKYHIDFVFSALQYFKDPIYDDLLWTLWADEKRVTTDVFIYLSNKDPQRAYELTRENLLNSDDLSGAFLSFDESNSSNITELMLNTVLQRDRELGFEIIRKSLTDGAVFEFQLFASKAGEIKDRTFIESLFERLAKEWNAHIYLKAAEVLISFNDPEINRRILETRSKNINLRKDWGGKAFDALLQKHGIQ